MRDQEAEISGIVSVRSPDCAQRHLPSRNNSCTPQQNLHARKRRPGATGRAFPGNLICGYNLLDAWLVSACAQRSHAIERYGQAAEGYRKCQPGLRSGHDIELQG